MNYAETISQLEKNLQEIGEDPDLARFHLTSEPSYHRKRPNVT